MSFLLANDLREKFHTEGAFYRQELNGERYLCRSLAKIGRLGVETDVADALFVLVNPGSCRPEDEDYEFPHYNPDLSKIPFVQAKSDPTQYQIMRLMERMEWNMIYIINLSDLCAGKIDEFKMHMNNFESNLDDTHSIFSLERKETIHLLLSEKTKVIAGWGTQPFIKERAFHALSILSEFKGIYGLSHKTAPYYYHPYPMVQHKCIKWLDDMCEAFEEAARVEQETF